MTSPLPPLVPPLLAYKVFGTFPNRMQSYSRTLDERPDHQFDCGIHLLPSDIRVQIYDFAMLSKGAANRVQALTSRDDRFRMRLSSLLSQRPAYDVIQSRWPWTSLYYYLSTCFTIDDLNASIMLPQNRTRYTELCEKSAALKAFMQMVTSDSFLQSLPSSVSTIFPALLDHLLSTSLRFSSGVATADAVVGQVDYDFSSAFIEDVSMEYANFVMLQTSIISKTFRAAIEKHTDPVKAAIIFMEFNNLMRQRQKTVALDLQRIVSNPPTHSKTFLTGDVQDGQEENS